MFYMLQSLMIMAKCRVRAFMTDENGDVNIVSMVVLMGIVVILAVFFKDQIKGLIENLVTAVQTNANDAINGKE